MAHAWRIEYDGACTMYCPEAMNNSISFVTIRTEHGFFKSTGEMSEHFDINIFAYVLMGNNYHLLLKTNRSNLSKGNGWDWPIPGALIYTI